MVGACPCDNEAFDMTKTLLMTTAVAALLMLPAAAFADSSQQPSRNNQAMSGQAMSGGAWHQDNAQDAEGHRATEALNLLEAKGYTQFSNFRRDGKDFEATVNHDGRQMAVMIDPDSNTISQQTASAGNPSMNNGYSGSSTAGTSGHSGSWSNQPSGSSGNVSQTNRSFNNPEGGAPPVSGVEGQTPRQHSMNNGYSGSSTVPPNGSTSGPSANRLPTNSNKAYHDFYNPEGGSPPVSGVEASSAKKH